MIRPILCLVFLFSFAADAWPADSTISGLNRIHDTYLQDRFGGDDNYGGATSISVGWKDDDYPNSKRHAYLWFEIPQNIDTCAACTLSLYLSGIDGDPDTLDLFWCIRDVSSYTGNNSGTNDPEDGEMTWLSYFDDDDGFDSAWTNSGGDYNASRSLGSLIWEGTESIGQFYKVAMDKYAADSLLSGSRGNYGLFLVGRVGGEYGDGNTQVTFRSVDYGDNTLSPRITFYNVGPRAEQSLSMRRRNMSCRR